MTGESLPVEKGPGDPVVGGSINRSGAVTFRATKVGSETALAQIVALVQRAQSSKAPGQRLADRAAQYLVILAVGSGIVTFLAWMLFGDAGFVLALTFAISAVVIACPDALGLATPTAVAVGTGIAARHNILIKDAATLEGLSGIQAVVLDKTGTLTEGKPSLTDVVQRRVDEDDLLRIAACAERAASTRSPGRSSRGRGARGAAHPSRGFHGDRRSWCRGASRRATRSSLATQADARPRSGHRRPRMSARGVGRARAALRCTSPLTAGPPAFWPWLTPSGRARGRRSRAFRGGRDRGRDDDGRQPPHG